MPSNRKLAAFMKPSASLLGALIAAAPTFAKAVGYPTIPYEPAISALGLTITALASFRSALDQGATTEMIKGHLTGGDSYVTCSVELVNVPSRGGEWTLCIEHHGSYPIPDTAIEVTTLKPGYVVERVVALRVGTLNVGQSMALCPLPGLPDSFRWQIQHFAPNGNRTQSLACETVAGQRVFASRTWTIGVGGPIPEMKIFEETVDSNFPRTADGQIDWSRWDSIPMTAETEALIRRMRWRNWILHPIRSVRYRRMQRNAASQSEIKNL
jgi:hypothetical protein